MANFLVSALQVVVGLVLVITGFAAPIGVSLIISGVFSAAAIALTPDKTEATDEKQSPTYGFSQFRNPVKGDSPVPVIYTKDGHKTAPVWLQAFVTPRGLGEEDVRTASRVQQLSGLLAIAEGPIDGVKEIRFNDEVIFEQVDDYLFGTGTGARKTFVLPHTRVDLHSVEITAGGQNLGYFTAPQSILAFVANGRDTTYTVDIPDNIVDDVAVEFFNANPAHAPSQAVLNLHKLPLQVWQGTKTQFFVHRDEPLALGTTVYMRFGARQTNGVNISRQASGAVLVRFTAAPSSGVKLYASFIRKTLGQLEVFVRRGSAHQRPIWGFHQIRNTFGIGTTLLQGSGVSYTTKESVDDMLVNIESSGSGFFASDDEGDISGVSAQFKIEVQLATSTGTGNTFDSWYRLPDPQGANPGRGKNALEFAVNGKDQSTLYWSFSVRNILEKNAAKVSGNGAAARAARAALKDFKQGIYDVRVTRTNIVKASNNPQRYVDEIVFASLTETKDQALSHPGTALLGFHAMATARLNGSAPNITVVCKAKSDVEHAEVHAASPGGYRWIAADGDSANRVWAAVDLITSWRYGAGEHYTKESNIDLASAVECAQWLDDSVRTGNGKRAEIISGCQVSTTSTFARPFGSFLNDGFAVGQTIATSGFSNAANNGTFVITGATASLLTVAETLVVESAATNKRITFGDVEVRSQLDIVIDTRKSLLEHLRDILVPGRIWAVLRGDTWFFVKDDAVDLTTVPVLYDDTPAGRTAQNSLGFNHDSVVSRPTEVQLTFLNGEEEWQPKEVWVVPQEPGDAPRRIRRVTASGMTRDTEVARYGKFIFDQLRNQGASVGVGAAPKALDFGAGDVIRIVSNRVGIDGYWRVFDMSFDTDTYYVKIEGKQYLAANYGETGTQTIIRSNFVSTAKSNPVSAKAPAALVSAKQARQRRRPRAKLRRVG